MTRLNWLVAASVALAILEVFRVSNVESLSRLVAPCYLPLVMIFLVPAGHERLVRARWWCRCALAASALGGVLLFLGPSRPLFPVLWAGRILRQSAATASLAGRVDRVYGVYARRAAAFAPAVDLLPSGEKVVGIVTYDDPETSFWKPYGGRCMVHVCLNDTPESLRAAGIRYVWVNGDRLEHSFNVPLNRWLRQFHGRVERTLSLVLRAGQGPVPWHLVRLLDPNEHAIHVY